MFTRPIHYTPERRWDELHQTASFSLVPYLHLVKQNHTLMAPVGLYSKHRPTHRPITRSTDLFIVDSYRPITHKEIIDRKSGLIIDKNDYVICRCIEDTLDVRCNINQLAYRVITLALRDYITEQWFTNHKDAETIHDFFQRPREDLDGDLSDLIFKVDKFLLHYNDNIVSINNIGSTLVVSVYGDHRLRNLDVCI